MDAIRVASRLGVLAAALIVVAIPSSLRASSSARSIETSDVSSVSDPSIALPAFFSHDLSSQITLADSEQLKLIGQVGGNIMSMAVQGNYVYVGAGPRLVILNASTPATMTVVGQTDVLPGLVEGVAVSGAYAYVADGQGGLRVINVSNPTAPVEIGSVVVTDSYGTLGYAERIAVADGHAYVTWGQCRATVCNGRLWIIDVSSPVAPTQVGIYSMNMPIQDLAVSGGKAYIACSPVPWQWSSSPDPDEGLWIVDVSIPAAPSRMGFLSLPRATDIALAGGLAYVSDADGLQVVNVSNPAHPSQIGFYATPGEVLGVAVSGSYAYIVDQGTWDGNQYNGQGIRVVNISNPRAPVGVGFYAASTSYILRGLVISGSIAYYIPVGNTTLLAVNVSNPATPVKIGSYKTWGGGNAVAVAGNYAYVAAGGDGLQVVDISNPTAPHVVGAYDTPGTASEIAVAGHYAYIADQTGGLRVVNVLTPTAPTEAGFYTSTSEVLDVAVWGSYAYLACGNAGLRVVSLADPAHPVEVGGYTAGGSAVHIAFEEGRVFVGGYGSWYVVDVSNPAAPVGLGSIQPLYNRITDLAVADGYAYIGWLFYATPFITESGLDIVDVSNPISPTQVGRIGGYVGGVTAVNGVAYVAELADHWSWQEANLCLVDVSIPAAPTTVVCHGTPGTRSQVRVSGGYIYDIGSGGLYILRESFFVGGRIADVVGTPFSGVTVSASGGLSTTTNANGIYTTTNLLHGTYLLTPTLVGYSFWPATRTVTLPPVNNQQNFTILPAAVSVTLETSGTSSLPARLIYSDTQNLRTQLEFPAGAVTQTTRIALTPTWVGNEPGFAFAGHAFDLAGVQGTEPLHDLMFQAPVTVTIHYSDLDIGVITDESQLALWRWSGSEWKDAMQTCNPPSAYTRDEANNTLNVAICSVGLFSLFGPTHQVYLPLVFRSAP